MCTALKNDHYFGRNLDLEKSYGEKICVTPRNFPLHFRKLESLKTHHAIIGMAIVVEDYPLYFDAINEWGLGIAGLNFPDNATYYDVKDDQKNITPFELIPYLLGKYKTVSEVKEALKDLSIVNIPFNQDFPLSPLHWLISDTESSIVLETLKDGMKVYDNPIEILCNNPTFDYHLFNLNNYQTLSKKAPINHFSKDYNLNTYSFGMGAMGLPGDLSSMSRFVRLAFYKLNSYDEGSEESKINHFFKLLESVSQIKGANEIRDDAFEYTVYTSCADLLKGIYYYKTYENSTIYGIGLKDENLDDQTLKLYDLKLNTNIKVLN